MEEVKTIKICRHGIKEEAVLAKLTKYGLSALTYANRTQACKMTWILRGKGVDCDVIRPGRAFLVKINEVDGVRA